MEKKTTYADDGLVENDYCDLDPTKICDNCCKCLEKKDADYKGVTTELDENSVHEYYAEDAQDEDETDDDGTGELPPLDIDPALLAEWEEKLRQAQLEDAQREKDVNEQIELGIYTKHDASKMHGKRKSKAKK